mmetsp:Transcript_111056/g.313239  ORF Transcript_111056/g.313239 Transcript_111056/m.313239 type:complete len:565 (-) Transcript_111056:22-1716(-)
MRTPTLVAPWAPRVALEPSRCADAHVVTQPRKRGEAPRPFLAALPALAAAACTAPALSSRRRTRPRPWRLRHRIATSAFAPPRGELRHVGQKGLQKTRRDGGDDIAAKIANFEGWLRAAGARIDGVKVRASKAAGLGVFATRRFRHGDILAEVPRSICIEVPFPGSEPHRGQVLEQAASEIEADVLYDEPSRNALVSVSARLLTERRAGAASRHAPYVELLPEPPALHPIASPWPARLVEASPLLARMYRTLATRDAFCLDALAAEDPVWKWGRWALGAVWTRAFELFDGTTGQNLGIVPLLDLANHWTPRSLDDAPWSCTYEERGDVVVLLAERAIAAGEELTLLYDDKSDAALLCQYGIAPPAPALNLANEAALVVQPSVLCATPDGSAGCAEASLVSARAATLERHGWRDLQRPLLFSVPKDTKASGGLIALARLLALESADEIEQQEGRFFWMDAAGGQKLRSRDIDPDCERRAWAFVHTWTSEACKQAAIDASNFMDGLASLGDDRPLGEALGAVLCGEVVVLENVMQDALTRSQRRLKKRFRLRGGARSGRVGVAAGA